MPLITNTPHQYKAQSARESSPTTGKHNQHSHHHYHSPNNTSIVSKHHLDLDEVSSSSLSLVTNDLPSDLRSTATLFDHLINSQLPSAAILMSNDDDGGGGETTNLDNDSSSTPNNNSLNNSEPEDEEEADENNNNNDDENDNDDDNDQEQHLSAFSQIRPTN